MSCLQNSVAVDPVTHNDAVAAANLNTANIVGLVDKRAKRNFEKPRDGRYGGLAS